MTPGKGRNLQGVIFDLDGTVTDTLSVCVRAFREAIEPLSGRHLSDETIINTFGPSEEGTVMALVPDHYDAALAAYLKHYQALLSDGGRTFPGITDLLDEINASGVRLGLVTGKGAGTTELTLSQFGLSHFFSDVGTGSPSGIVKAQRMREMVERWKLAPKDVTYIGDSPADIIAAREARLGIISAAWSSEVKVEALQELGPDAVMSSVDELRAWWREHASPAASF